MTRELCPHHVSHYLGMDVHDTDDVSRGRTLQPGTVVTVEPGKRWLARTDVWVELQLLS